MAKNKEIIEESFSKMKSLLESRINEAPVGQSIPAASQPSVIVPSNPEEQLVDEDSEEIETIDASLDEDGVIK